MIQEVSMTRIVLDENNPRKVIIEAEVKEIADSVDKLGLIHPIVVRLKDGKYLIVVGEKRFRAFQSLGRDFIPADIRELTDREALEWAIAENMVRSDIHPLEETDAFIRMMDSFGLSPEEVANRFGKSVDFVYKRIKLKGLTEEAKILFMDGVLSLTHCLELIKVSESDQEKCLSQIIVTVDDKQYCTKMPRQLREYITNNIEVSLSNATFKLNDMKLVPAAGPCTTCQFRSGFNKSLFNDIQSDDICFNPGCFVKKTDANLETLRVKEIKKGNRVVELSTEYYLRDKSLTARGVLERSEYSIIPDEHKCNQPESCTAVGFIVHGTTNQTGKRLHVSLQIGDDGDDCECLSTLYFDDDNEKYITEFPEDEKPGKKEKTGFVSTLLGDDNEEENTEDKESTKADCLKYFTDFKASEELQSKLSSDIMPGIQNPKMLDLIILSVIRESDYDRLLPILKEVLAPEVYENVKEEKEEDITAKAVYEYLQESDSIDRRISLLIKVTIANTVELAGKGWYHVAVADGTAIDLKIKVQELFEIDPKNSEKEFKLIWDKFDVVPLSVFNIINKKDFFKFLLTKKTRSLDIDDLESIFDIYELNIPEDTNEKPGTDQYCELLKTKLLEEFSI